MDFVAQVILSEEERPDVKKYLDGSWEKENRRHPVDLELELVLGKMPQKVNDYEMSENKVTGGNKSFCF